MQLTHAALIPLHVYYAVHAFKREYYSEKRSKSTGLTSFLRNYKLTMQERSKSGLTSFFRITNGRLVDLLPKMLFFQFLNRV